MTATVDRQSGIETTGCARRRLECLRCGRLFADLTGGWCRYKGMRASEAQRELQAKRPHILHVLDRRPVMLEFEKRYGPVAS